MWGNHRLSEQRNPPRAVDIPALALGTLIDNQFEQDFRFGIVGYFDDADPSVARDHIIGGAAGLISGQATKIRQDVPRLRKSGSPEVGRHSK